MQRVLYQHLIQFLIALAVGTLTGGALLPLLPHAFLAKRSEAEGGEHHGHGHNHHQHERERQRSRAAIVGGLRCW